MEKIVRALKSEVKKGLTVNLFGLLDTTECEAFRKIYVSYLVQYC